ncbi:MAG: alanine racemase [Cytophagales bacterium]|nr:alanine racemase [Cytophagales bacterium]
MIVETGRIDIRKSIPCEKNTVVPRLSYTNYKKIFKGKKYPLAFVNMGLLDENITQIVKRSKEFPIRIASKSIRCSHILEYIFKSDKHFRGIMSFSGTEAIFLSKKGFDDILVAYPVINEEEISELCAEIKRGKYINLMVDKLDHIHLLSKIAKQNQVVVPISVDIDMSVDFPGLHFGVWRSSIRKPTNLRSVLEGIKRMDYVKLEGIMGYEAQIAGVTDKVRGKWLMNNIVRSLKKFSINKIASKRRKSVNLIKNMGFDLRIVNGGGTGSLESTIKEDVITEVTVGSGFFNSHLFDNYSRFRHEPAAGFACAINRHPSKHIYTCSGGGYVASGATEPLKLPLPILPQGAKLLKNEGAGEVQTPFTYRGKDKLNIGDPVFFRHSKAGELCERFNSLYLIRDGKIEDTVPTYRGEGMCFL